jgi:hypothetical protein
MRPDGRVRVGVKLDCANGSDVRQCRIDEVG